MTVRQEQDKIGDSHRAKVDPRPASPTVTRLDGVHSTRTATLGLTSVGLTNARTRIVGNRTGFFADVVIAIVRLLRSIQNVSLRVFSRIADVVTPLGWSMSVIVPASFLIGYGFGWVELVAVAFAGLILLAIAVLYLIGRSAFAIELRIPHARVVVGQPATGVVVVKNRSRLRVLGARVEIPVDEGIADFTMPSLAREAEFRHEFPVPTNRRGIVKIGPVRTVRADPVGMVRRELVWTDQSDLFVHPRTVTIPSISTGLIRDLEGQPTRDLTNSDVSFHALREYVPGDERRYIHWKSTAKTGTYMVRQFEETRRSRLVVALSLAAADYASDDEFEMAVSTAGSLGLRAIRDARDVSVVVGEKTPEFAKRKVLGIRPLNSLGRSRLLDDLAGVQRAESSLNIDDLARVASEKVTGISVAYLVCGSPTTSAQLRSSSAHFPVGVEVVAVICDPETVPGLRRIAGLNVLTIGYLEDLQRSLARAAAV